MSPTSYLTALPRVAGCIIAHELPVVNSTFDAQLVTPCGRDLGQVQALDGKPARPGIRAKRTRGFKRADTVLPIFFLLASLAGVFAGVPFQSLVG